MKEVIDRAIDSVMLALGDRHAGAEEDADKTALRKEIAKELRAYAKKHGLRYAETGLLSVKQLGDSEEHPIGSATEPVEAEIQQADARTVLDQMFEGRSGQLYQPYQAQDMLFANRFAYWKIADRESHVPQFEEAGVKEQVLEAWRISKARPIAEKRAKELSEKIGDKEMSETLIDETVNGKEDGILLMVRRTERFSWLRRSSAPSTGMPFSAGPPVLSEISWVEGAGDDFMRTVFDELADNEVGVAANDDRSVYYVVRVKDRIPPVPADDELFKQRFIQANLFGYGPMLRSPYDHLTTAEQQELTYRWSLRLQEKYAVYWNPKRDEQRR